MNAGSTDVCGFGYDAVCAAGSTDVDEIAFGERCDFSYLLIATN